MRSDSQPGFVFVYEPVENRTDYLLAIYVRDDDPNPELVRLNSAEEIVKEIEPWATPLPWQPPLPTNLGTERKRLEKVVAGIKSRSPTSCQIDRPKQHLEFLESDAQRDLAADLQAICADRLIKNFPWDASGRLALRTSVLLRVYDSRTLPWRDRRLCLAAIGPERRKDKQQVRVAFVDLIVPNQTHRWHASPWQWTAAPLPNEEWIGTAQFGECPRNQLAMDSLRLLQEGEIVQALANHGVELSDEVYRLLGGQRISPPACCARPNQKWTDLLVGAVRQAAPWRLAQAATDEAVRLNRWAAEKKSRRRRPPSLKMAIFPGQHHSRKASLMLTSDLNGDRPQLVIDATASNVRLHDTAWKLPLAANCVRHGIDLP